MLDQCRVQAERALLGAVLLDPAGQHRVLDLVQPDDMRRPWHAQVLEAMQRVRARGAFPDPMAVYAELQNDPDLPTAVSRDGVLMAGLMEAAPTARHARAYAVLVIEGVFGSGFMWLERAWCRPPERGSPSLCCAGRPTGPASSASARLAGGHFRSLFAGSCPPDRTSGARCVGCSASGCWRGGPGPPGRPGSAGSRTSGTTGSGRGAVLPAPSSAVAAARTFRPRRTRPAVCGYAGHGRRGQGR